MAIQNNGKCISLSLDDYPRKSSYLESSARRKKIHRALQEHKVSAIFFVVTDRLSSESKATLKSLVEDGHLVGNHTHRHPSADEVGGKRFIEDVKSADAVLKRYEFESEYFRYPYLRRGSSTIERKEIWTDVSQLGYRDGFVTIDNWDWYLDSLFQKEIKRNPDLNFDDLRDLYLHVILDSISFYHKLGNKALPSSICHNLLLHENDLAALFLGELISSLKQEGWKIESPHSSFRDPLLTNFPRIHEASHNQGRVAALAKTNGYKGGLESRYENEHALLEAWEKTFQGFRSYKDVSFNSPDMH